MERPLKDLTGWNGVTECDARLVLVHTFRERRACIDALVVTHVSIFQARRTC